MKICFLLHFYQPHNQQSDILNRVVHESYLPLTRGLINNPEFKISINISGALIDLLNTPKYQEVLDNISILLKRNQIELLSSSMYHGLLPLLPDNEVTRQIELHDRICKKNFGNYYNPKGFFSPEMAISSSLMNILSKRGINWLPVPSTASSVDLKGTYTFKDRKSNINVLFRNKRVSSLILSSSVKNAHNLILETKDLHKKDKYWFCVMDAETFGHHRVGLEKTLFDILGHPFFKPVLASELVACEHYSDSSFIKYCDIVSTTWTNSEQDVELNGGSPFTLWNDPDNKIHNAQWKLSNYVIDCVNCYTEKDTEEWRQSRSKLDSALSSDQFWWASAKPWWSLEMIEQGAFSLKDVLVGLNLADETFYKVDKFYREILDLAFDWQRSGYIRKKHLENSSTYMKKPFKSRTHAEWYNQIILEFEDEMLKAAKVRNYELAIKWRDAIKKLKLGTDIYDVLHVVDELWSARSIPELKPFFSHTYTEFSKFALDNFKDLENEHDFNMWKKTREKRI